MSLGELTLEARHCVLCGPDAPKLKRFDALFHKETLNGETYSPRRRPQQVHFRMMECKNCKILFSDPAPVEAALAHLYSETRIYYEDTEESLYRTYSRILNTVLPKISQRRSFVDIGGGAGFMLRWGKENAFEKNIEVEPSRDAEQRFSQQAGSNMDFICQPFSKDTLPRASASVVSFIHVLDHTPDPKRFLEAIYDVLEPGGVAFCVLHNANSWHIKLFGEKNPLIHVTHTYLFNPKNAAELFKRVGFTNIKIRPLLNIYPLRWWAVMVPLPVRMQNALVRLFNFLGIGDVNIGMRVGNFSIIAQKPSYA